ncbi:MAG: HEAT repeat domain-containing protein [Candidatus Magnetomorum sp.]|nr:HEAT repeat domain-containing protein [Candidatus Magnetomorum sp.]
MAKTSTKRTGVSGFMAKVIDESGNAVVNIYDGISYTCIRVKNGLKKTTDVSEQYSKKAKLYVNERIKKIKEAKSTPKSTARRKLTVAEARQIREKIKKREKKIASLYYKIGKEGSRTNEENPLEQETVKKLITDVRGYEKEIDRLQDRITELETAKQAVPEAAPKKEPKQRTLDMDKVARARAARAKLEKEKEIQKQPAAPSMTLLQKSTHRAIQAAIKTGSFKTTSERAKFETIAKDLLDPENEIRVLAAAELSKMENLAAVPVLIEIGRDNDPFLKSEAINSLINLNDLRAIPLFKEKAQDPHYRVRIASLRGLYKMIDDDDLKNILIQAIRDEHPEVRKTAVTFIGWKDYSDGVPPLVQCLNDDDNRVQKAAISALANIRDRAAVIPLIKLLGDNSLEIREKALSAIQMIVGEEISFDTQLTGDSLSQSIKNVKEWWQQKRINAAQSTELDSMLEADLLSEPVPLPEPEPIFEPEPIVEPVLVSVPEPVSEPELQTDMVAASDEQSDTQESSEASTAEMNLSDESQPSEENDTSEDNKIKKSELKKLDKSELIQMSEELGLEVSESFTKNRIIRNIMEHQEASAQQS